MSDIDRIVTHIRSKLADLNAPLPDPAYDYSSLGLCVIDAVFSIGAHYSSTEKVVQRFCERFKWIKEGRGTVEERRICDLLEVLQKYENRWDEMALKVFGNRQRTSSRSGIRKAEAAFRFAKIVHQFGIKTFADALKLGLSKDLETAIKTIEGQGSGISLAYFLILAGHQDVVKPDRWVRRFVANALGRKSVAPEVAVKLVRSASLALRPEFPNLVPSVLENKIWNYERGQDKKLKNRCESNDDRCSTSAELKHRENHLSV
jgi:hypothetical protein